MIGHGIRQPHLSGTSAMIRDQLGRNGLTAFSGGGETLEKVGWLVNATVPPLGDAAGLSRRIVKRVTRWQRLPWQRLPRPSRARLRLHLRASELACRLPSA